MEMFLPTSKPRSRQAARAPIAIASVAQTIAVGGVGSASSCRHIAKPLTSLRSPFSINSGSVGILFFASALV